MPGMFWWADHNRDKAGPAFQQLLQELTPKLAAVQPAPAAATSLTDTDKK